MYMYRMSLHVLKRKSDVKKQIISDSRHGMFSIGPRQYSYGMLAKRNTSKCNTVANMVTPTGSDFINAKTILALKLDASGCESNASETLCHCGGDYTTSVKSIRTGEDQIYHHKIRRGCYSTLLDILNKRDISHNNSCS